MRTIPADYTFSEKDNIALTNVLLEVSENPYANYTAFSKTVRNIADDASHIPASFLDICEAKRRANRYVDPFVILKNCPVDPDLPFLDFDSPVEDKRKRKKTYVAEAFLELYARLMRQEPISYINVNDGDIFQDIHPMRKLMDSQSQKSAKTIYFHKDLANHFVRPDWVNILGLRASPSNKIYTSFVSNKDLIEYLDRKTLNILREVEFYTPFDDLTKASPNKEVGRAANHPILGGEEDYDIRFFENRTVGLTSRAKAAVTDVTNALHTLKRSLLILKGDFIGASNNECIHNKEVVQVDDQNEVYSRWLMKTVNVKSLDMHKIQMREGEVRIING